MVDSGDESVMNCLLVITQEQLHPRRLCRLEVTFSEENLLFEATFRAILYVSLRGAYAPECVEGRFSELRMQDAV